MAYKVKRFQNPSFSKTDWEAENPTLRRGEIGVLLDDQGLAKQIKVGPGKWNDLMDLFSKIYSFADPVTNPLGDLQQGEILEGTAIDAILRDILSPYQAAAITGVTNNAKAPSFESNPVLQIGQSVSGTITIKYSVTNPGNVANDANPVNASGNGIFSNEGFFPIGDIDLNLVSPLSPTAPVTYTVSLYIKHLQGNSPVATTKITFHPVITNGVSPQESLTANEAANIPFKSSVVSNNFERDYAFSTEGYAYLFIPSMLNPGSLIFTDVTDPNRPAGYSILDLGTLSINNGFGAYNYRVLRSEFYLLNPTILRVRKA